MKSVITIKSKKYLIRFSLKPLASAIIVVFILATSPSAIASSCACSNVPTTTIEESNDNHPNQLTLSTNDAYYQLMNQQGEVLQDKLYEVEAYSDGRIVARRDGYFGVVAADGQLIYDFNYDKIELLSDDLYLLSERYGQGYVNALVKGTDDWLYPISGKFENAKRVEHLYYDETNDINYFKTIDNDKVGLINDQKQMLIPNIYDALGLLGSCSNKRLFITVNLGKKKGLIDQYQNAIVPLKENQRIYDFNEDEHIFSVQMLKASFSFDNDALEKEEVIAEQLIKGQSQTLLQSESEIENIGGNLYRYSQAGKVGIINDMTDVITPAKFDDIYHQYEQPLLASKGKKIGIIGLNHLGLLDVDKYYDELKRISIADKTLVELRGLDKADDSYNSALSTMLIDDVDNIIYERNNDLFIAKLNGKFGLVDSQNKIRIPFIYEEISEYYGALKVKNNQKYGLLTTHNETIAAIDSDGIGYIKDTDSGTLLSLIYGDVNNNKIRIINNVGRQVLPLSDFRFTADEINGVSNSFVIEKEGKYGWLNDNLDAIRVDPIFENIEQQMYDGSYIAQKDGKKVWVDADGFVLSDGLSQYDYIGDLYLKNILRVADKKGKQGVISADSNAISNIIVPLKYDGIDPLMIDNSMNDASKTEKIYYMVELDNKYGLLDEAGKTVLLPQYPSMSQIYYSTYFIVSNPNTHSESPKFGVIDITGKVVKRFEYDEIYNDTYDDDKVYMIKNDADTVDVYNKALKIIKTINYQAFKEKRGR